MKKSGIKLGAAIVSAAIALSFVKGAAVSLAAEDDLVPAKEDTVPVYGLYNPNSGEHLFTANVSERAVLLNIGWEEGDVKWMAPSGGEAVYRLYNPNVLASDGTPVGDHHYTSSPSEQEALVDAGWKNDGFAFYSIDGSSSGGVPIYGLYNPNAYAMGLSGAHHLTLSEEEAANLLSIGWKEGGPRFYGYPVPAGEIIPDVLANGEYHAGSASGAVISDDLRMLTIKTDWWWSVNDPHWYRGAPSAYPKKEYHIPISAECTTTIGGSKAEDIVMPLSKRADAIRSLMNENESEISLFITVKNGEIIDIWV